MPLADVYRWKYTLKVLTDFQLLTPLHKKNLETHTKKKREWEGENCVHILVTTSFIVAFFVLGKINEVKKYEGTIMYVIIVNLFYFFLCGNFWMWQYKPHIFLDQFTTDLLYIFIVMPMCTYFFLKYAPQFNCIKKILIHMFKWSILFFITEWIYFEYGAIIYDHGWNLFWSAIFYIFMFPLIYLHHYKRTFAYIISVLFVLFLINYFKVPFAVPVQDR